MKPSRVLPGLLVLVLVVLAISVGLSILGPDPGASEPYTPEPVTVTGGELDVNQTELWGWTQRAMDRNVDATPTIVIREFPDDPGGTAARTEATQFQRLLVYDDPDQQPPGTILAFVTALSTDVTVNADRLPAVENGSVGRTVEGLLVHEFAHVVQFRTQAFVQNQLGTLTATTDETRAYHAVVEGGAEFVADHYTADSEVERVRAYWNDPRTSAAARLGQWPYYRGLVYLHERLDDPGDLWGIYEDRPATTATILRGDAPGDGPPDRSLALALEDYHVEVDDRPGAALAEVALTREIDPERARDVAAGWRWGALRSIQPDSGTATDRSLRHVWVTEWRSEAEADAFETAMTEYLDGRWQAEDGTWSAGDGRSFTLERVDDDALALLVGPDSFLAEATVTITGEEYRIESETPVSSSSDAIAAGSGPSATASGSATSAGLDVSESVPAAHAG